jgi:hypothetical protein
VKVKLSQMPSRLVGERLRCVGRRLSKPRLIHYTHDHRAIIVDVEGTPAVCEVIKEWRIKREQTGD